VHAAAPLVQVYAAEFVVDPVNAQIGSRLLKRDSLLDFRVRGYSSQDEIVIEGRLSVVGCGPLFLPFYPVVLR
jgi:hypothetical protein